MNNNGNTKWLGQHLLSIVKPEKEKKRGSRGGGRSAVGLYLRIWRRGSLRIQFFKKIETPERYGKVLCSVKIRNFPLEHFQVNSRLILKASVSYPTHPCQCLNFFEKRNKEGN